MKSALLISVFFFLALVTVSSAEEICPGSDKWPAASGAHELKMYENHFNLDKAMKSVSFLEKDVIKMMEEHKGTHSILEYEGFYIGYPNDIAVVKGTLLKQDVLIAKNRAEIERLKLKNGTGTKKEVSTAEQAYLKAQKRFCDFLKQAERVD